MRASRSISCLFKEGRAPILYVIYITLKSTDPACILLLLHGVALVHVVFQKAQELDGWVHRRRAVIFMWNASYHSPTDWLWLG
jgi:hypothetical protein